MQNEIVLLVRMVLRRALPILWRIRRIDRHLRFSHRFRRRHPFGMLQQRQEEQHQQENYPITKSASPNASMAAYCSTTPQMAPRALRDAVTPSAACATKFARIPCSNLEVCGLPAVTFATRWF
jgi:hypothetical protein